MPKANSAKGLDENFFAAFDELAKLYGGDVAFEPLKEAVEISRARKEKGEELTPEGKRRCAGLLRLSLQCTNHKIRTPLHEAAQAS